MMYVVVVGPTAYVLSVIFGALSRVRTDSVGLEMEEEVMERPPSSQSELPHIEGLCAYVSYINSATSSYTA